MKTLPLVLAAASISLAFAREQIVPNSTSPDKSCHLVTTESENRISYEIVDTSGRSLLSLPSSYQPRPGEVKDFAWHNSATPAVHWRKDGQAVAIDEQNYRTMGTVLVARRKNSAFARVDFPKASAFMKRTGLPWDRGRLFFTSWPKTESVEIGILGRIRGPNRSYREADATFTISLKNGAVLSASPPSLEHAAVAYAPAVTTFTGVIVEQPYDDEASPSERGKAAWILKLEAPVAVEAKAGDAIDVAESDVTEIHLNADPSKFPVSKKELGRTRFQATGTLYHAHTTHHLRPIVMLVSDLENTP